MNENRYFDIVTLMPCTKVERAGEAWLDFDNGDARRVGEGEVLLPLLQFQALINLISAGAAKTPSNPTAIPQSSDSVPTATEQRPDSVQTETRQQTDSGLTDEGYADKAEKARLSKPKPPTAAQILKRDADVVKLLKNARFVAMITEGVYKNFRELPANCPQKIVDEINRRGIVRKSGKMHTQDTVSAIVDAMKIEDRPNKAHVVFLISAVVFFVLVGTKFYSWITEPTKAETRQEQVKTTENKTNFDFDSCFLEWRNKTKKNLTETRKNIIKQKSFSSKAELLNEFDIQFEEMVKIMKQK